MRRWIWMVFALLLILWFSPNQGTDVGDLQPVELLAVCRSGENVVMMTDTGDIGKGPTLKMAWKNLKETTSGTIFLETADYLLLTVETEELVSSLTTLLRPGTEVCLIAGELPLEDAARYLSAHPPGVMLRDMQYGMEKPPFLRFAEGRFIIEE